jgi:hypothetical protein
MKACPVSIAIQSAAEKDEGHYKTISFLMFGAPRLETKTEITDLGPDLAAKIKAARERFYAEKGAEAAAYAAKNTKDGTPGTIAYVRCLAPRKPAGFDAATRGEKFEAAPTPAAPARPAVDETAHFRCEG